MAHRRTDLIRKTRGGERARRFLAGVILAVGISRGDAFAQNGTAANAEVARDTVAARPLHDAVARLTATPAIPAPQGRGIGSHPVLLGTAIGAAGGAVWQASACGGHSCNVGTAALVGAGAGAYGGLIAAAIQKARAKQPVGRGLKIGIAAGALAAVGGAYLACYGAGGCGGAS